MLETLIKLWITSLDFIENFYACKNFEDGPKAGIFQFIEKVGD